MAAAADREGMDGFKQAIMQAACIAGRLAEVANRIYYGA